MALNPVAITWITAALAPVDADPSVLSGFHRIFPGLSLTRCNLSDMLAEEPFREYPRFNIYLVDGSDHCWRFTSDPACATGLVVAEKPFSYI
jgi:hypothetical protein